MKRGLMWRAIVILGLIGASILFLYPPKEKINLGLDLRGGMQSSYQVKTEDAVRSETDQDMEQLRRTLEEKGVPGVTVRRTEDAAFEVAGLPPTAADTLSEAVDELFSRGLGQTGRWTFRRDGDRAFFTMTEANRLEIKEQAVEQALQTIRNRIDAFGVAEPQIAREGVGGDRIVMQLPGVDDPERIRELVKSTAFLEFRMVDRGSGETSAPNPETLVARYGGSLPDTVEILPQEQRDETGRVFQRVYWALEKRRVITGRELRSASPGDDQFQRPVVTFNLSSEGARIFAKATSENIGHLLSIVLDGKVQSAATIQSRIADRGQITGDFTREEVQDLVLTLRSGALPATLVSLGENTVSASLGQDSIDKGLRAGMISIAFVVLSMLIVYKFSGTNAILALLLNVVLLFGGLGALGATLTLPGIAGIVLTIGMAFDANVLVFERIKEELAAGRTIRAAIDAGFDKAMSSIMDANITTLISALFLFVFGTGPIKGFAATLTIGIIGTLIAAVFFSRFLFDLFLDKANPKKLSI